MVRKNALSCFRVTALAVLGIVTLASCARERSPINRVQPFALQKAHFVGEDLVGLQDDPEFYALSTLVDVGGYGAAQSGLFTSTYAQSMVRVKWQITESLLLGRLAYERIDGAEGGAVGASTNEGQVVMAFPIKKHFDVVRSYNPTTGEQLNILEENASDRPWYEREYMRVDWSKNQATDAYDFDTLSLIGVYGSIKYEPLAYDVTDPRDPDALHFDLENGYFDITNKAFAKPQMVDLRQFGWGIDEFPACYLDNDFMSGSAPSGNCNPVEVTMRFSFRRVVENDYEAADWDGYRFQSIGAFYSERYGFARNYGMTDDRWHRFINRMNIWERSHYYEDPEAMTGHVECYTPVSTPTGADPHRDVDGNGTEDECEAVGNGSRCNTFKQRCTLPYRLREVKPLSYYVTVGSNLEYYAGTKMATHEWDVALRMAVQSARYAECKVTDINGCSDNYPMFFGQQDDHQDAVQLAWEVDMCRNGEAYQGLDCDLVADTVGYDRDVDPGVIAIAKMQEMIVLCHSPVQADDPAGCGEVRLPETITTQDCQDAETAGDEITKAICHESGVVRLGDLRYHQVNIIKQAQSPSSWGIWTGANDPVTGEIVSNCSNVWSHVTDYVSQLWIDQMRYIAGEIETDVVTEGKYIKDWSQAAASASKGGVMPRMTRSAINTRIAEFSGLPAARGADLPQMVANLPESVRTRARNLRIQLKDVKASVNAASLSAPLYAARRQSAAGTSFEAQLMTPAMQEFYGVDGMPMSQGLMQMVSPLQGGHPGWQRDMANMKEQALAKRGACIMHAPEAMAPYSTASLGKLLQEKFGAFNPDDSLDDQAIRAEKMRRYLAHRVNYAVLIHEMGHAIGMRHNFVSSAAAYSYRPQYWQLRTKNGAVTDECADLSATGEDCVGPRYYDPVTEEERDGMIWMWMQSSVMDYAGEISQDLLGLAVFDFAAARFFYGDVMSVNADSNFDAGSAHGRMMTSLTDNFGGIIGITYDLSGTEFHYSQLNDKLRLIDDCVTIPDPEIFKPSVWDEERDGIWSPLLDGLMVKVDGEWTRCKQQKVDYVPYSNLRFPTVAEVGNDFYRGGPSVDGEGRTRVPYGFATDGWADLGNVSVYRHDNGADPYEIFNFLITQQEVNHIFDNYRRGRTGFSVRSAANRTMGRYNGKVRDGAKGLGLMKNIYRDFAIEVGYDFDTLWPSLSASFFRENIIASSQVFDHFTRMVARPEVGEHYYLEHDDQLLRSTNDALASVSPADIRVTIPNGATGYFGDISLGGKLVENQLSTSNGEYDSRITVNAGQYYDKLYTAMLMTESVDNFISSSRNDFVDPRYRAVSLADLFPEGYRRWLATNLTGDELLKGARIETDAAGVPLVGAEGYPSSPIGYTSWWGETPEACFPNQGTTVCSVYGDAGNTANPQAPAHTRVVDAQVGWEQQKFLIAWTMLYIMENETRNWYDLLRLWELGLDSNPDLGDNRIEFHNPNGQVYIAHTFGKESIFGQSVQRGIAARVLGYANKLLEQAYEVTDGPDLDSDGNPDWYLPVIDSTTGMPVVKYDPTIKAIDTNGAELPNGRAGCDPTDNSDCTCTVNRACVKLGRYVSIPAFLREAVTAYSLGNPEMRGIYD
jgi:hypothetical protein